MLKYTKYIIAIQYFKIYPRKLKEL